MKENSGLIFGAMFICIIFMYFMTVYFKSQEKKNNSGTQDRDKHIKSTRIIAVNGVTPNVSGKVLRGMIVGGMLAGEEGALYGAIRASNQSPTINEYTFLVKYDDAIQKTEKVKETSPRFQFLISKLED